jgi:hypothetical protein
MGIASDSRGGLPVSFAPRVIMCATCHKPVERIEQFTLWPDTARETVRIRVHCHRESQEVDLLVRELVGAIEFTAAFVPPKELPPRVR